MKLLRFRVTKFRSVSDSGWIDADDVTALIGVNESGKTNLLLPLWKMNPANDGEINLLADAPRKLYNDIKGMADAKKPVFIEAHFALSSDLVSELVRLTGATMDDLAVASVSRRFDGKYIIRFPNEDPLRTLPTEEVVSALKTATAELTALQPAGRGDEDLKQSMLSALSRATALVADGDELPQESIQSIQAAVAAVDVATAPKRSTLAPRFGQLIDDLAEMVSRVSKPAPTMNDEAKQAVLRHMPKFVYYSNYGNLDSEIYLPHVIENLSRSDLGGREAGKARTLKVLFDFVKLSPTEILELGQDLPAPQPGYAQREPTAEEIEVAAERKKEREVLLQSASSKLTSSFRNWWKQGEHRIRFQADGNHFRIWVSDDIRPEEIELEGRSTGLQWFLSFYLTFLVESGDEHSGAILLLDEPGLTLHPLSQKDLSLFFESLSKNNQMLYTTHSPFLVDADHLDRARVVYVDDTGATVSSSNLRAGERDPGRSKAIYAVYAALGLNTSDVILQGCQPVIVEGTSDQYYLSAIKNFLVRENRLNPSRELVFPPAGGVRGVAAIVSILSGKDEALPYVVLDADRAGKELASHLKDRGKGLYKGDTDRVLLISDIVPFDDAEIEDLLPLDLLARIISRVLHDPDDPFEDFVKEGKPFVPQVETFARKHGIRLSDGWKVDLAKQVKARLLRPGSTSQVDGEHLERWTRLFQLLDAK